MLWWGCSPSYSVRTLLGTLECPCLPLTRGDCPTLWAQGLLGPISRPYRTHRPAWEWPHLPIMCWHRAGTWRGHLALLWEWAGSLLGHSCWQPSPLMLSVWCWQPCCPLC